MFQVRIYRVEKLTTLVDLNKDPVSVAFVSAASDVRFTEGAPNEFYSNILANYNAGITVPPGGALVAVLLPRREES